MKVDRQCCSSGRSSQVVSFRPHLGMRRYKSREGALLRRGARRQARGAHAGDARRPSPPGDGFHRYTLDLAEQDPFSERIYEAAGQVGWGHTTTYGALTKDLGAGPGATRDVGQAMAKIRWR